MKKVFVYTALLLAGLVCSQFLPLLGAFEQVTHLVRALTMIGLSFIMIHVGYEFEIDKRQPRKYGWDYLVAFTAAAFPWVFVTLYLVFAILPPEVWWQGQSWKETLLAGRFASPTSAGVLFAMLAAAGLGATWLFRKARILAIFDDLDTVLLMIPLQMLMIGLAWQLGLIVLLMAGLLWAAWRWLHAVAIPITWPWVLGYAVTITLVSELVYAGSKAIGKDVPIHIEVLLPAFVLGCIMKPPAGSHPHAYAEAEWHEEGPDSPTEQRVSTIISGVFMLLVGLSMPPIMNGGETAVAAAQKAAESVSAAQPRLGWGAITLHVLAVTLLSNLGKMFPALCYRREAHWRHRLALAIGMWPRGEVGAGVLVISLAYGIGGPVITVAMLSLTLNLALTGAFIVMVKKIIANTPELPAEAEKCGLRIADCGI